MLRDLRQRFADENRYRKPEDETDHNRDQRILHRIQKVGQARRKEEVLIGEEGEARFHPEHRAFKHRKYDRHRHRERKEQNHEDQRRAKRPWRELFAPRGSL